MLEKLKFLSSDLKWLICGLLGRCPICYSKEQSAKCGIGCINKECSRFDSCVAIELDHKENKHGNHR